MIARPLFIGFFLIQANDFLFIKVMIGKHGISVKVIELEAILYTFKNFECFRKIQVIYS